MVGIIVVVDELSVDAQYLPVVDKDVVDVSDLLAIARGYLYNPRGDCLTVNFRKPDIYGIVGNHYLTDRISTALRTISSFS